MKRRRNTLAAVGHAHCDRGTAGLTAALIFLVPVLLPTTGTSAQEAAQVSGDWPAFGRDAGNTHHSPLAQIDRGNVARLRPAWLFQTGVTGYFQAEPVVIDGVMYVSTTGNHVAALEAKSGKVLWTYTHKARTEKIFGPPSNRGVAVSAGLVFEATMDGRVIALDAKTGRLVWDREAVRPEEGRPRPPRRLPQP